MGQPNDSRITKDNTGILNQAPTRRMAIVTMIIRSTLNVIVRKKKIHTPRSHRLLAFLTTAANLIIQLKASQFVLPPHFLSVPQVAMVRLNI